MLDDRALIQRAFVGYFMGIERWRIFQEDRATYPVRAAGSFLRKGCEQILETLPHRIVLENCCYGRACRELWTQGAARLEVGEDHHADVVAIMTRDDDVPHKWCEEPYGPCSQGADAHPGAGGELEVFGEAAVK